MSLQKEVFEEYKSYIENHMVENKEGALKVKYNLEHSPLFWNNMVDKTVHIPKVYDKNMMAKFEHIANVTYSIFGKIIEEYRNHEDYRALFPFSKELEELILLPRSYDGFLPMARFDLFFNEENEDFYFCEINTDGTAAQLRNLEMSKALIANPAHQHVIRKYNLEGFELFDSWVDEFINLYNTYPKKSDNPNIAIVDFLENATMGDFYEFARRFQQKGCNCEICDIRELEYRDGVLYSSSGNKIDAIYRRAVTADIMNNYDAVKDFINAIRDDAVFFAGAFDTQIIHAKWLFYVLHLERTWEFLTDDEVEFVKKHVPDTKEFSPKGITIEEVSNNKDKYMLKPMDAYASKGIYAAGKEYSQSDWDELLPQMYGNGYIAQRYCEQYLTDNIDFAWGDGKWHKYMNMPGLYMYNGKLSGFLMRMAEGENIIYAHENERTVPVFVVK